MLPEHLRNATPEEVFAWHQKNGRKARFTTDECQQFFRQRMRRDGKEGELDSLIAKYRDDGKGRRLAIYAAMRDMGYINPKEEQKLYKRWIARAMNDRRREVQTKCVNRYRTKMRNKELDAAMDKLPPNASPEKEMDWVAAHRKLFHVSQLMGDTSDEGREALKTARTLVADDIWLGDGDHRNAPSQGAATMLVSALRNPDGWMEKKRDAHKGKTEAGVGGEQDKGVIPDDISALKRIHEQFLKQKRTVGG
jgi:hypothetical protein